jgi:hypothetical protein
MEQYISQLENIANSDDDWTGVSAIHVLGCIRLYQSGELSAEAATHNLKSIQNRTKLDISLEDHNKQDVLNNLIILVSNIINKV